MSDATTEVDALVREMSGAKFRDRRLNERLGVMVQRLASAPDKSFPKAFPHDAELEAAYRFFANPAVTPAAILESHVQATLGRMRDETLALIVHDTTTFKFRAHGERKGLGRIKTTGQGFFGHVSLALAADGSRRPLGVLAHSTHVRDGSGASKEQERWAKQALHVSALARGHASVVHVMDREADDYALLADLAGARERFIIRVSQNRLLARASATEPRKLDDALTRMVAVCTRDVPLSRRPDAGRSPIQKKIHPSRAARDATLAMGATQLALLRPRTQPRSLPEALLFNVVHVWEIDTPEGVEPVEWTLLTSEPIETPDDITRVVDAYRARWTIEEFFKALKTGCNYEKRQLDDFEGLANALALFLPIAWHLLVLRSEARREPDAPALRVVTSTQLDVLRALGPKKLPAEPTARDVMLAIAALGGHIRWSGEPGWLTLGRGYQELLTLTRGWEAAKLQHLCDQ